MFCLQTGLHFAMVTTRKVYMRNFPINLLKRLSLKILIMSNKYKIGDHVTWNSEAGHVSGKIIKVHTKDFNYKGYTHHASEDDPQYEIKSDKSDHIAVHKGKALSLVKS